MRAVIYEGAGGPEVITIGEVPKPEVGKDHIRVRVHAAGLNRADLIQRRGFYPGPPTLSMMSGRIIMSGQVQSETDALNDASYDRQAAGVGHWRRMIGAPLLKDGQPIGAGMAFARDLAHIVDGFFYLGYLWPLWDAKRQTFADKICSTVVLAH